MMSAQGTAASLLNSLPPASYAAGANNGNWVDVRPYQGEMACIIALGAVTGSVVVKLQDATDGSGTGAADLAGATTASLSTANSAAKIVAKAGANRGFIRVVATVTTGPVFASAAMAGHPGIV